jgi:hypothetical protein
MQAARDARHPRARRLTTALLAATTLLLAGGVVVYGPAQPAAAAPVEIDNPLEIVPITDSVWPFDGHANPFEEVTVQVLSGGGIGCTDVADATGAWSCNVTFTETNEFTLVQAISFNHTTPDQIEDTQEYAVTVPPTVTATPQTPGIIVSNQNVNPAFSGLASPNADIDGTIGGLPCNTTADGGGQYTCQAIGVLGADGDYPITVSQVPTWGLDPDHRSADGLAVYRLDTVTGIPDFSYPYDTIGPGDNVVTSDQTPLVGGDAGTAEPFGTVTVYADDLGGAVFTWPPGPGVAPGTFFCNAVADATGAWSCSPAGQLPVGSVWVVGSTQDDLAGNSTGSPDAEFTMEIIPPPPPPTILQPVPGYTSESRRVHVSTTNLPEGTVYVREGATNICPPTPVGVSTFSCDTVPLEPGVHVISVLQEDSYGTLSAPAQRTVTILAPPAPVALKTLSFTFRLVDENGDEIGESGLSPGDRVTLLSSELPPGTTISAEIHSTPIALGGTTLTTGGPLTMSVTVPQVDAGDHEIVITASAPGYSPATVANAVRVRERKQIPETTDDTEVVEDEDGKQLGTLEHQGTGTGGPGSVGAGGWGDPSVFGTVLESPFDPEAHAFALSPAGIVLSGSIAIAFLLLVGFPAELLESTIRSNYDRAFGWLARLRRRVGRMLAPVARLLANPWAGSLVTILAASVILGFADPGFGFTATSVRLVLAMMVSVLAVNVGLSLIVMRVARRAFDVASALQPMPAALGLVALSVLVSRLAGISPGFLFGFVLGIVYARELKLRDDARLGVLGVGLTLAAGVLAWLGYGAATAAMSGEGFVNNLVIEVLAAITLEALGTLVVALLPIEFLDGRTIFRWSKVAWLGLYLITVLVFLFVVVPLSDNWGTMSAPILGWGTLFAVFAVVAVATWAIFRRRVSSSSPEGEARRPRARR